MSLIEHTFSPTRLLVLWQAPEGNDDRSHFVVGELRNQDGVITFQYLPKSDDYCRATQLGFEGYPAFRKRDRVYSEGVIASFARRLPPRKRGDFSKYLAQWRLPADVDLSDFDLLGYSGGKLPTDGFSVVWPLNEVTAPGEILLEVAGFRYQGVGLDELSVRDPVKFVPEPDNPYDRQAIRIESRGRRIGYVKRQQQGAISRWLTQYQVEASIERFNGTSDRPVVYIFCRIAGRSAAEFTSSRVATA